MDRPHSRIVLRRSTNRRTSEQLQLLNFGTSLEDHENDIERMIIDTFEPAILEAVPKMLISMNFITKTEDYNPEPLIEKFKESLEHNLDHFSINLYDNIYGRPQIRQAQKRLQEKQRNNQVTAKKLLDQINETIKEVNLLALDRKERSIKQKLNKNVVQLKKVPLPSRSPKQEKELAIEFDNTQRQIQRLLAAQENPFCSFLRSPQKS